MTTNYICDRCGSEANIWLSTQLTADNIAIWLCHACYEKEPKKKQGTEVLKLTVEENDSNPEAYDVLVLDDDENFMWSLDKYLTFEGANAVLTEASKFFQNRGCTIRLVQR